MKQGAGGKCGFCGRRMMRAPFVRARGVGFCCNSCCKAYQALYPAGKKEAGKHRKAARKGKAGKKNGKRG